MDNRRYAMRFEKAFPVLISSDFGYLSGVCRNFSTGGMAIEMIEPLPLGSSIEIHFPLDGTDQFVAKAEVKHQYFFNYQTGELPGACRGIGVRFRDFATQTKSNSESFAAETVMH